MAQLLCSVECQLEDILNIHHVKKIFLGFIGGISCQAPAEILLEINKKQHQGLRFFFNQHKEN